MDFKNANELLDLCKKHDLPISEVMRQREIVEGEKEADTVHDAMAKVLEIMKKCCFYSDQRTGSFHGWPDRWRGKEDCFPVLLWKWNLW